MNWDERPAIGQTLLIALVSIAILALVLRPGETAQRLVSRWRPQEPLTRPEPQQDDPGAPSPLPISAAATPLDQLDLQLGEGLYTGEQDALSGELQRALGYVVARFGSEPSGRITTMLVSDAGCGLHGIAYTDIRQVQVFTCPGIARVRAVAILAHEFVHQLAQDRYGAAHLRADTILAEGVATWGAGEYWLGGQPDFRAYVRGQRQAGSFYPLATDYRGLGVGAMNALYYEWASFVEYLIGAYGREQFDKLYASGGGGFGNADYAGVYGKPLADLEREWVAWLE
jgi:hypothetical protein